MPYDLKHIVRAAPVDLEDPADFDAPLAQVETGRSRHSLLQAMRCHYAL
jgi:hypothetical protein